MKDSLNSSYCRMNLKKLSITIFALLWLPVSIAASAFDAIKLKMSYEDLTKQPNDISHQRAFFDAFPSTWTNFINAYGFLDNVPMLFYTDAVKHIQAFKELTIIPIDEKIEKIINITVGGVLDADAPNYWQDDVLEDIVTNHLDLLMQHLLKRPLSSQFLFWSFYLSNPVKKETLDASFEKFLRQIDKDYPHSIEIIKAARKYFYGNSAHFQ